MRLLRFIKLMHPRSVLMPADVLAQVAATTIVIRSVDVAASVGSAGAALGQVGPEARAPLALAISIRIGSYTMRRELVRPCWSTQHIIVISRGRCRPHGVAPVIVLC